MDNNQQIGNIHNSTLENVNTNSQCENKKYTKEEFIKMIEDGEIKLSVNQIKGLHGGTYSRDPALYDSFGGDWSNTEFIFSNVGYNIPTLCIDGVEWFHLPMLLRAIGLLCEEGSDIAAFSKSIPYHLKRCYCPFGKGIKRVFINREAFEQIGLSIDGRPKVKRKYNLEYTGVVTLNTNIDYVERNFIKLISKLKDIEDIAILCDVHRILKQLQ